MSTSLPEATELVDLAKAAIADGRDPNAVLDAYAPAIDELADAETLRVWLGWRSRATIYQERSRKNADGSPRWPASDVPFGRSGLWRYRTIVLFRAAMVGQGTAAGRGRPRKAAGQES